MDKWYLDRFIRNDEVTLGKLHNDPETFGVFTLELPWKDNQRRISCIPTGKYIAELDFYHKGGYPAYELRDVPGRDEIKIHIGNYTKDVLGCIAIGLGVDDSVPMVTSSRKAYEKFMDFMKGTESFELEVRDDD